MVCGGARLTRAAGPPLPRRKCHSGHCAILPMPTNPLTPRRKASEGPLAREAIRGDLSACWKRHHPCASLGAVRAVHQRNLCSPVTCYRAPIRSAHPRLHLRVPAALLVRLCEAKKPRIFQEGAPKPVRNLRPRAAAAKRRRRRDLPERAGQLPPVAILQIPAICKAKALEGLNRQPPKAIEELRCGQSLSATPLQKPPRPPGVCQIQSRWGSASTCQSSIAPAAERHAFHQQHAH